MRQKVAQNHIRCQWRSTFKIGAAQVPSVTDSARERKYYLIYTVVWTLGSLNKDIFERRMSTESIFPFNMPWLYPICISKCLFSHSDDLPENLVKITPQVAKRPLPVNVRRSKTSLLKRYCLCSHGTGRIFGRLKIRVCRLFRLHGITSIVQNLRRTSRSKYSVNRANILKDPEWTKWPLKFCSRSKIRSVPCERSSHSLIQADCLPHSCLFIKCRTKVICVLIIAITIQHFFLTNPEVQNMYFFRYITKCAISIHTTNSRYACSPQKSKFHRHASFWKYKVAKFCINKFQRQ